MLKELFNLIPTYLFRSPFASGYLALALVRLVGAADSASLQLSGVILSHFFYRYTRLLDEIWNHLCGIVRCGALRVLGITMHSHQLGDLAIYLLLVAVIQEASRVLKFGVLC